MNDRAELERIAERLFDGDTDPRELERFEQTLSHDPARRAIWEDLKAARTALADAGLEEAPHDLRPAILRAVAADARPARTPWFEVLVASLRVRPALALGSALVIGIVIGALGLAAMTGGFDASSHFAPSTVATMPASPEAAAPAVLDLDGAHLEARTTRTGRGMDVVVHMEIPTNSAEPTTVVFTPTRDHNGLHVALRGDTGLREGTLSRP